MSLEILFHLARAARSAGDQEKVSALLDEGLAAVRGLEQHRRGAPALHDLVVVRGTPALYALAKVARLQGD